MSAPPARLDRRELVVVVVVLAVAAALRLWRLDLGWFGVDQARDIQTALDIAAGRDWPTVGPTMRRVTSLGALYYYFWALPHLVSRDPLAAYRFAAGLGIVAVVLVWALARRLFGVCAGLVAATALATSRVAVIDARVAWAPAALPCMAAVLLWLLVAGVPRADEAFRSGWGRHAATRLALVGALLGLAVQLHLAMAAWVIAAALLVTWYPPGLRPLAAGFGGLVLTGLPAAWAVVANAGDDAGVASIPGRGPFPDVAGRLVAAVALAWRVPSAFWQWPDAPEVWGSWARGAAMVMSALALLGGMRLLAAASAGARVARTLVLVAAVQVLVVACLPGEAWYYYLDAVLPLWALAAGALVAPTVRDDPASAPTGASPLAGAATAVAVVAGAILALHTSTWLGAIARHGYLVLDPAPLTLDGGGGRDAAAPGRLLTLGSKRAVAAAAATEPAPFAMRWRATHGPAFDDATGDNGFWLARSAPAEDAPPTVTHATLWYRDDPAAPTAAPEGDLAHVGPLVIVRQHARVLYERCRDDATAAAVAVPIRVVPHPRAYGDGVAARALHLPARLTCALAAGRGGTRVVAAVTAGTVTVRAADGTAGAAGRESTLCLTPGDQPTPFSIEIAVPSGVAADLDLYERPDAACAAGKIAP